MCVPVLGCIRLESVFMCVCLPVWEVSSVGGDVCVCTCLAAGQGVSEACPPTGAEGYFLCEQDREAALGT